MEFPVRIPLGNFIEFVMEWLTDHFSPLLTGITLVINATLQQISNFLNALPWPIMMIIFIVIAWRCAGRKIAILTAVSLFLLGGFGLWKEGMDTLAMVVTSVLLSITMGLPLGILSAYNDISNRILRPVLDGMQTIPSFVYLIPAVMLFGIGNVPGIIATVIFALPPMVRLTDLGIRQVPFDVVEAGRAFGCTPSQLLVKIQLPLAMPSIMTGVNQTVMMALSMVVTSAMIGAGGLGVQILTAIQQVKLGLGVEAGLGILFIAIILDRILQGVSQTTKSNKKDEALQSLEQGVGWKRVWKQFVHHGMTAAIVLTIIFLVTFAVLHKQDSTNTKNVEYITEEKVIIGGMQWSGSIAIEQIMKYVLEKKLHIPVEIKPLNASILFPALDNGTADIYPDLWMPNQQEGFDKYVSERKTVKVKLSYDNAPQGFYMSAKIAKKHGIKSIFDLRGKEGIFDSDGDKKGEIWVGPFSWGASEINISKIEEYNLQLQPLKIEQWLFLAMFKEAMRKDKPIVFYYWEPEWPMAKFDLVRLEEPKYEKSKWVHVKGEPDNTNISCAYPPATVYVGISKKLKERIPKAYQFFSNWSIPIEEVSFLIAELEDVPGNPAQKPQDVARRWVESHPEILEKWLKEK
ncbi:glycine betaine ABC transporter substrate-binding protein [Candidatus Uabimicrobium sp. HlEnr_7]|uniref:glycine betaine ABC transporter substrate-binding protein n=1 Tax=Candidatus Uabimicrobium helgolandensis TaxID=3095367 RepID=UPI0035574397